LTISQVAMNRTYNRACAKCENAHFAQKSKSEVEKAEYASSYSKVERERGSCCRIIWVENIKTLSSGGLIYAADAGPHPIEDKVSGVFNVTFLRHSSIPRYINYIHYLPQLLEFSIRNAYYMISHDYDLLVTIDMPNMEGLIPYFLSVLKRRPIILKETHWYWPDSFRAKVAWAINMWLVNRATLIIVPGKRVYEYWRQVGISSGKIKIVPFYSSLLKTNPNMINLAQTLRGRFENKVIVAYFGRLLKKKGVEYLIRAFAKIESEFPFTALAIGGDGPERSNLQRLSASLGIREIEFFGALNPEDKPAFFVMSDIYVCPCINLRTPEEWGMVVTEAMSVGKPVVVTNATGNSLDLVEDGVNGYIVPEKDSDSLYKAIKSLVEDRNLRNNMGKASKKMVTRFDYDCGAQAMIQAIRIALRRNPHHKK